MCEGEGKLESEREGERDEKGLDPNGKCEF